jgi:hypothetical protein
MNNAKALIVGALALVAFSVLVAAIVVLAPYIAGAAVIAGGIWYFLHQDEPKTPTTRTNLNEIKKDV